MAGGVYQAEKNKMNSAFGSISKLVSWLEHTLRLCEIMAFGFQGKGQMLMTSDGICSTCILRQCLQSA